MKESLQMLAKDYLNYLQVLSGGGKLSEDEYMISLASLFYLI